MSTNQRGKRFQDSRSSLDNLSQQMTHSTLNPSSTLTLPVCGTSPIVESSLEEGMLRTSFLSVRLLTRNMVLLFIEQSSPSGGVKSTMKLMDFQRKRGQRLTSPTAQ